MYLNKLILLTMILGSTPLWAVDKIRCDYKDSAEDGFTIDLIENRYQQDDIDWPIYDMNDLGHGAKHPYRYYLIPPFGTEIFLRVPRELKQLSTADFDTILDYYDEEKQVTIHCRG